MSLYPSVATESINRFRTDGGPGGCGTVVGIAATDGTVMAASTRTSGGGVVQAEFVERIVPVHPTAALGSGGNLDRLQPIIRKIRTRVDQYSMDRGRQMDIPTLGSAVLDHLRSHDTHDDRYLLGGVDGDGAHVFTISRDEGVLETDHTAVGSGGPTSTGVLDEGFTTSITVEEGRILAAVAVEAAIDRDARTGGDLLIVLVKGTGVDRQRYGSVDEMQQVDQNG